MTPGAVAFVAFLVIQRLTELLIARRNTRMLLSAGAREVGAGHYPLIVALHVAWLIAIAAGAPGQSIEAPWLAAFAVLQILRIWVLATLGRRWTTRIIVTDEPLVARGPFRLVRHPNYVIVVAEIFVAPMVLGLVWVAVVFSVLNALVLTVRIRAEESALSPSRRASGAR
jgi:methyltransferase